MSLLKKTIGFMAVLGTLPAAYALTARPSVIGTASRRMPTMTTTIYGANSSTTNSSTTSALLANAECIDAYTSCMKGADACGPEFEECTTRVLFHGKMAQCLSTLAQCNSAGIQSLFGVGNINSLQTVATKNSYGEVTDYTYPTDGSLLGQTIIGAAIANKYDTSTCVKRYTSCLKKDSVCGDDFELCTTDKEFRKQRVFCDSTLARCQSDGVIELFGSNSLTVAPSKTSRIGELIEEGAKLAATNAVKTCYKVTDQCILNACATNPYRCSDIASKYIAELVDDINEGNTTKDSSDVAMSDMNTKSDISRYIKSACLDTIGTNKYCYATFLGDGLMPTASQLKDEDNQEEIFDEAYSARMNTAIKAQISDLVDKFDTKAKQKCSETIRACAMRTCGSGSGAACYYEVFSKSDKSINNADTRAEIKTGCEAIVNTDPYCKYAAANPNASGPYSYAYINTSAFDTLFPEYDSANPDPIGVVASLNASLANSYSDAALAQMKKQCQSVATSCVKSLCGSDYVNCYRNRTDVYSSLTNTGESSFDKSMNKVGGVLDYTIVLGLCLDTVKNASVCEEHLAIEANKLSIKGKKSNTWGTNSVRGDWIDAGSATSVTAETDTVQALDENGQPLCSTKTGDQGVCYTVDAAGNVYDQPVMIAYTTYVQTQAASTLFKDLIYDIEKEAQAKYNAKITKEQNACLAANQGGILGKSDTGAAYMWVKLRSNKVPKNYSVAGLKPNQMVASNDLYGSFCRVRVTLQSDDKRIQDAIRDGADWSTAYFAVGDVFSCGSWIPSSALEEIANKLADEARNEKKDHHDRVRGWLTTLGVVGGSVGGGYLGSSIADGRALSSLTGLNKNRGQEDLDNQKACEKAVDAARNALLTSINSTANKDTSYFNGTLSTAVHKANTGLLTMNTDEVDLSSLFGITYTECAGSSITGCKLSETNRKTINEVAQAFANKRSECKVKDSEESNKPKSNKWVKPVVTGLTTVVGGVTGGILLNKITGDIQAGTRDAAAKAAYDEFMNEVGRHISCYIGGEEAGVYGDVVQPYVE